MITSNPMKKFIYIYTETFKKNSASQHPDTTDSTDSQDPWTQFSYPNDTQNLYSDSVYNQIQMRLRFGWKCFNTETLLSVSVLKHFRLFFKGQPNSDKSSLFTNADLVESVFGNFLHQQTMTCHD